MRRRVFAMAAVVLLLTGCTTDDGGNAAAAPASAAPGAASPSAAASPGARSSADAAGCAKAKRVNEGYAPLFGAVYGKVQDAIKHNDQKTAVEGLQKADQLVKEWTAEVEPLVDQVAQGEVHDALVTLLDQLRQYTSGNGMNAGAVAKAAGNVTTALANGC